MMVVDLVQRLRITIEINQKNPSVLAILVMIRFQPAFDGFLLALPAIWLIFAVLYRLLVVLKVLGGGYMCLWWREDDGRWCPGEFWSVLPDFLFYFSMPSHAYFRLSMESFDVELGGERLQVNGRA